MSNYTYTSGFLARDSLPDTDADKVIKGAYLETEFTAVQTAVNSKADSASPTFTGTLTAAAVTASGAVTSNGTLTASSGASVTGNITVTGTVDGRDVATDGTKLDGIETGATADQAWGDITGTLSNQTDLQAALDAKQASGSYAAASHNHAASEVTSGTFADARISESSVTQHEAAIDAGSVDGYSIVVDSGSPSGTDANTIYFVT
jgi:hypothetical protein